MKTPDFNTKKELFDWLIENKATLITQKKAVIKHADGIAFNNAGEGNLNGPVDKANIGEDGTIGVTAIINTTNLMDSHDDVHIPGLWNKSLKENKMIMHLQEHQMEFAKIISDGKDLKATTREYTWKELGAKLDGTTQALVFDSSVKDERKKFMFNEYRKGNVKNHSVGMRYVKLFLAVNDEDYKDEYAIWEKYIDQVANDKAAIEQGYFWAVTEAKVIEGSAVPLGSNQITPTLDIKEPLESTQKEPLEDTLKAFKKEIKNILN